jgi:hypothetical protein
MAVEFTLARGGRGKEEEEEENKKQVEAVAYYLTMMSTDRDYTT